MSKETEFDVDGEKLKSLHISSLDEEEDEAQFNDHGGMEDDFSNDDDSDDEEEQVPVTLGFVVKPKNEWLLLRQYFPSKAGGSPAWLDPVSLPSEKESLCDFCGEPLHFLLQVYAPLSEESTFHRTLFVFMCPSMACLLRDQHEQWKRQSEKPSRSVKVFRCQLPGTNSFYSSKAPSDDGTEQPLTAGALLCNWCGTWKGDKLCGDCRRARYCSGKHQASHWRSGHRVDCRQQMHPSEEASKSAACNYIWKQYEITDEDECELDSMSDDNQYASSLVSRSQVDESVTKLMKDFEGDDDRKSWASFQERVSRAPDQVLRYSSSANAKPLWPMSSGRPSKPNIPKCNYCGGTGAFEFQVLPQLLYFLDAPNDPDSLDWATIVVYTCEASCGENVGYKEEFAWVQLASQSTS